MIIASKGQPMSVSFDPHRSIVLFASEAEALNVPIDIGSTQCLPLRIDLDGSGEIVRLGERRQLMEGGFKSDRIKSSRRSSRSSSVVLFNNCNSSRSSGSKNDDHDMIINSTSGINNNESNIIDNIVDSIPDDSMSCLLLPCNVEIRSYLLDANAEISSKQLMSRCISINVSKTTYDPYDDLVLNDLDSIPAVIDAIDKGLICDWMGR